jgi:hypothetical protein
METFGGVAIYFHTYLSSTLDAGVSFMPMATLFTGKQAFVTSNKAASCHAGHILLLVPMLTLCNYTFFFLWPCVPTRVIASSFLRFLDHTQRRTTVGRIPLDEWSARRKDLYLTTHNIHNRQTSMPPVEFEPTISAGGGPQTYALERAANGTGVFIL